MPYKILKFPNDKELARTAAAKWLAILKERATSKSVRPYLVALSGGRIAKTFFSEIVRQALAEKAPASNQLFEGVHFFWADERCVPPTDSESNYAIAQSLLLGPLRISEKQIHRLRGEGPEPEALGQAIGELTSLAPSLAGQPVFDLIFLGMGEDGHVASIFPEEDATTLNSPAVYRAVTAVKPPPRRITLGLPAIVASREVWALVSGVGKENAFRESLSATSKAPMGKVLQNRQQTTVWSDI